MISSIFFLFLTFSFFIYEIIITPNIVVMKNFTFSIYFLLIFSFPLFVSNSIFGQSRSYIREQISLQWECRNVAITKTNGDLMLYGQNGYAISECPSALLDAVEELHDESVFIDDIQLTESGSWVILYGDNGLRWNDIPYGLENKLREFNKDREVITSITLNDIGDWIVISTSYISSSDTRINDWLVDGTNKYGKLWAACVTDDAMVAVFAGGYKFFGNVPESLRTALNNTKLDVYRLKIAGDSWFFADKNGSYQYNM